MAELRFVMLSSEEGLGHYIFGVLKHVKVYWKKKISIEFSGMTYYEAAALHLAAGLDGFDTLNYLLHLDTCPNVDETTEDGNTALHVAAWTAISGNTVSLLTRGADPTRENSKHGATPLHFAARYGHREAVSAFIDYGCTLGCANRCVLNTRAPHTEE